MGVEQEQDIARLISMGGLLFKPSTDLPVVSWVRLGTVADTARIDAVDDVSAGVMYRVSAHIEALCKQAQAMGPAVRVAISEPTYGQNDALNWQMTVNHQFLEPGAAPSMPGVCRVYGPFPAVDSTR